MTRLRLTEEELDTLIGLAVQNAVIEARAEYERVAEKHRAYTNKTNFLLGVLVGVTALWGGILAIKLIMSLIF